MAAIVEAERLKRWRLVLGKECEGGMSGAARTGGSGGGGGDGDDLGFSLSGSEQGMDGVLDALYGAERSAGVGGSSPRVARWLGDVRTFVPNTAARVRLPEALERLHLTQSRPEPELLAT